MDRKPGKGITFEMQIKNISNKINQLKKKERKVPNTETKTNSRY